MHGLVHSTRLPCLLFWDQVGQTHFLSNTKVHLLCTIYVSEWSAHYKDYLKVLQRWLGLWGLDGFTKLHSNKILKEYEKLKYLLHIFLLNKSKNKSGGCQIPLSPYHRQTWNLSKNLHDPIFGRKNFTHWKRVNWDYFCQQ